MILDVPADASLNRLPPEDDVAVARSAMDSAAAAVTGQAAGFKPAPALELATTSAMFARMSEEVDIDRGTVVNGRETVVEVAERIIRAVLASGRPSPSETFDHGDNASVPWRVVAVM